MIRVVKAFYQLRRKQASDFESLLLSTSAECSQNLEHHQNPGRAVHQQIEPIKRAGQIALHQHPQFFPDMRFWKMGANPMVAQATIRIGQLILDASDRIVFPCAGSSA